MGFVACSLPLGQNERLGRRRQLLHRLPTPLRTSFPFASTYLSPTDLSSQKWVDRIAARPAAQRGIDIPEKSQYNPNMSKEEQDQKAEEAKQWIHKK